MKKKTKSTQIDKALEKIKIIYDEMLSDRSGFIVENLLNQFNLFSIKNITDVQLIEIYNVEDYNAQCLVPFLEQDEDYESCAMITKVLEMYRKFYSKLNRQETILEILENINKANKAEIDLEYNKMQKLKYEN